MSDLLYELNARDEISSVSEEWFRFALANGLAPLEPARSSVGHCGISSVM